MIGLLLPIPLSLQQPFFLSIIKSVADNAGVNQADSTAYLGYTISISTFILALLGPILGTLADYKGMKGKFFRFFFFMGTLSTAALLFCTE